MTVGGETRFEMRVEGPRPGMWDVWEDILLEWRDVLGERRHGSAVCRLERAEEGDSEAEDSDEEEQARAEGRAAAAAGAARRREERGEGQADAPAEDVTRTVDEGEAEAAAALAAGLGRRPLTATARIQSAVLGRQAGQALTGGGRRSDGRTGGAAEGTAHPADAVTRAAEATRRAQAAATAHRAAVARRDATTREPEGRRAARLQAEARRLRRSGGG